MGSHVLDIGGSDTDHLRVMFQNAFLDPLRNGRTPSLPSALICDDRGLELWSEVTDGPEYYQTRDEVELFTVHGPEIVSHISSGCSLIDLGSGDLQKVRPLLDLLEASQKRVRYYALDLSEAALKRGVGQFAKQYQFVQCLGLWGSFDHAFSWISRLSSGPKFFLSLGSILGNGPVEGAANGLARWAALMGPDDRMLLCMDANTDPDKIWRSYHDSERRYERYVRNGLVVSNRVLGHDWYDPKDWEMTGILEPPMHQTQFRALRTVDSPSAGIRFVSGDLITLHGHFKHPPEVMRTQFATAGLTELANWKTPSSSIYDYLLRRS